MSAVTAATLLAFIAGALLLVVICVNVTDEAPSQWSNAGRLKCWVWSGIVGVACASIAYSLPYGAAL